MAWQDELKNLDGELSAGRITGDEHRRRRDEILAAASSSAVGLRRPISRPAQPSGNGQSEAGSDDSQPVDTGSTPAPSSQPPNPQPPSAPAVAPEHGSAAPEEAKPGWVAQLPGPVQQPIAGPGPSAPPLPRRQPGQHFQLPPKVTSASAKQGGEVFATATTRRSGWVFLVAGALAVILVALLGWTVILPAGDDQAATGGRPAEELSLDQLPNPTDRTLTTSGELTVDQAQLEAVVKPDEAAYLSKAGTEKIYYRAVNAQNVGYQIFAIQAANPESGRVLVADVINRGKQLGMADTTIDGVPPGVTVTRAISGTAVIFEAVYQAGRTVVRIVVGQPDQADEQLLAAALKHSVGLVTDSIDPS
jgi:hypothetical protein